MEESELLSGADVRFGAANRDVLAFSEAFCGRRVVVDLDCPAFCVNDFSEVEESGVGDVTDFTAFLYPAWKRVCCFDDEYPSRD